jgi:hypothetical protein
MNEVVKDEEEVKDADETKDEESEVKNTEESESKDDMFESVTDEDVPELVSDLDEDVVCTCNDSKCKMAQMEEEEEEEEEDEDEDEEEEEEDEEDAEEDAEEDDDEDADEDAEEDDDEDEDEDEEEEEHVCRLRCRDEDIPSSVKYFAIVYLAIHVVNLFLVTANVSNVYKYDEC